MRESHQDRAAAIENKQDREEYTLLMTEAISLGRRAVAMRKRAWQIFSTRDDVKKNNA
jgi:hypothetical protein